MSETAEPSAASDGSLAYISHMNDHSRLRTLPMGLAQQSRRIDAARKAQPGVIRAMAKFRKATND